MYSPHAKSVIVVLCGQWMYSRDASEDVIRWVNNHVKINRHTREKLRRERGWIESVGIDVKANRHTGGALRPAIVNIHLDIAFAIKC